MKNTYNFDFNQGEFVMSGGAVAVLEVSFTLKTVYGNIDKEVRYDV